ncbi:MAG: hypothetical protein CVU03_05630 [Bacteroidetes bacterium HGW-Bacteroidetes-2]|jgi:hypothetical protein|nr:MAG: hypothetical protein CVU03_05630 [Bacteroidetes bacterium HGW-Bacteroidetes-2]
MKLNSLFALAFLSFFTLMHLSCDNEPLEGDFVSDIPEEVIASFTAVVEGVTFVGDTAQAVTISGVTSITGIKGNGDKIVMTFQGIGVGAFNLTGNSGEATFGISSAPTAFSTQNEGGIGEIIVTQYDVELGLASGTFAFIATRALLDANGQPILDGNGNPTFDSVTVANGVFNNIPLVSDGSTTMPPQEDFMRARIDTLVFETTNLTIVTSGLITVQGVNALTNESLTIAFPETTVPGTYDLTFNGDFSAGYFNNEVTFTSKTGVLTIIENSANLIRFTFSFEASLLEDGDIEHVVTEGLFQYFL